MASNRHDTILPPAPLRVPLPCALWWLGRHPELLVVLAALAALAAGALALGAAS